MIDYYITMTVVLIVIGITFIIIGLKTHSQLITSFGVIPIMVAFLYWSTALIDIAKTWG